MKFSVLILVTIGPFVLPGEQRCEISSNCRWGMSHVNKYLFEEVISKAKHGSVAAELINSNMCTLIQVASDSILEKVFTKFNYCQSKDAHFRNQYWLDCQKDFTSMLNSTTKNSYIEKHCTQGYMSSSPFTKYLKCVLKNYDGNAKLMYKDRAKRFVRKSVFIGYRFVGEIRGLQ